MQKWALRLVFPFESGRWDCRLTFGKSVNLNGLSITQAVEKIRQVYLDEKVVQKGRERITVDLLTPRVHRVIVLREDTPSTAVAIVDPKISKRFIVARAQVIDLPIYENDVLHALASTGGLPGTDAKRELWVIRNNPA